ncbi:hypothetical protein V493_08512 [Pseudogymnoascus sp. VKM F-4281 (FW-2241)]|nr:hypothetical protein V493_08512 [Pseudogymnoascus sp. VKM F-4281 (FW-2241)]
MSLLVDIESQQFPGSYLRMDGTGIVQKTPSGSGIVNCQNYVGTLESLIIEDHPSTNTFSILCSQFPNVYLRMDGSAVTPGTNYPQGAGVVNLQYTAATYEQFQYEEQQDGSKAIVSVQFPGVYLRMDNPGGGSAAGTVNCQNYVGTCEKFNINITETKGK